MCCGKFSTSIEIMTQVSAIKRHQSGSTTPPSSLAQMMKKLSRFHPEATFSLKSLSQTLDRSLEAPASETKTFYKDCRCYVVYSLVVTLLDYPHIQTLQCPYINADYFEQWQISLHNKPNNQVARSKNLLGNHNVLIMHMQRSEISVCTSIAQSGISITYSPCSSLLTPPKTPRTSNLFAFSQQNTHSHI